MLHLIPSPTNLARRADLTTWNESTRTRREEEVVEEKRN
jgi:hypothetical protein